MKIPLRYQNTEYDCGTTSFINALAYLYDREDVPVELIKAVYKYTLDVENEEGIVGKGGTSRKHAELLARYFSKYASAFWSIYACVLLSGVVPKIILRTRPPAESVPIISPHTSGLSVDIPCSSQKSGLTL